MSPGRALLTQPAQVDSIAWNPHKMVGAPLQTSAFIVKHRGLLHTSNSANATYLFQQVGILDTLALNKMTGSITLKCLKLFMANGLQTDVQNPLLRNLQP